MNVQKSAMILAAGLGMRLRPLTNTTPKALVRIANTCLLDHALEQALHAGVTRCVVNMHYLAEQIEAHIARHPWRAAVKLSDERACLLETGGGVVKALALLGPAPFYVLNADYLWLNAVHASSLLRQVHAAWDATQMDALLALQPLAQVHGYQGAGDFVLQKDGRLVRWPGATRGVAQDGQSQDVQSQDVQSQDVQSQDGQPMVYIGAHLTSPALFDGARLEPFSLNRLWDQAIARGRLYGVVYQGTALHISTPADVEHAGIYCADKHARLLVGDA
jgi:N-acetyl-alpha-D-muramate 1-phosphate uridylyltransferase